MRRKNSQLFANFEPNILSPPEQIQITLFSFDELSEESQQKIIEGFRQEHEPYYEAVYEDFILEMSEQYGADIGVNDIEWSGFWSQGDGACFTCDFDEEVIFPILKERSFGMEHVQVLDALGVELYSAKSIRCGPSNFYSHENTVTGDLVFNVPAGKEFNHEIALSLEEELTGIIRESCKDLYRRLESYYDEETEDEAIKQRIKEYYPGCHFRKDGTIFAR